MSCTKITEPSAGPNRALPCSLRRTILRGQLRQPDATRPAYHTLLSPGSQSGNRHCADCPAVISHREQCRGPSNLTERSPLRTAHIPLVPARFLVPETSPQGIPQADAIPGLRKLKQHRLHERQPGPAVAMPNTPLQQPLEPNPLSTIEGIEQCFSCRRGSNRQKRD